MTPEQLQALREKIAAGRQPDDKWWTDRAYPRGWNGGLEFAEKCIREVLGESVRAAAE
jgi:hypothetical protein